ncbi:MAG: hypothetical protein NT058_01130 [Candidatus Portnoybacteria bacterium]|nr:hypothetical protein [Candidatus Portnoybacteria bacterium]
MKKVKTGKYETIRSVLSEVRESKEFLNFLKFSRVPEEGRSSDANSKAVVLLNDVRTFLVRRILNEMLSIMDKRINRFKRPIGNGDLNRTIDKFTKSFCRQAEIVIPECTELVEDALREFRDHFFLDKTIAG